MQQKNLLLKHGFSWQELFQITGLVRLDQLFLNQLKITSNTLYKELMAYRAFSSVLAQAEISEVLIQCAKVLEIFIADLFNIRDELEQSQARTIANNPIAAFKKYYVLKRAKKELRERAELSCHDFEIHNDWLSRELKNAPLSADDMELSIALLGVHFLSQPQDYKQEIDRLVAWCVCAMSTDTGRALVHNWTSFRIPQRIDHAQLINPEICTHHDLPTLSLSENEWRMRDGFNLTDARMNAREVQDEVNYCIYCHDHDGDFCSKGFPQKKGDATQGYKKNPLDVILTGCPLEEKISEMQLLKRDGHTIGSLAMVMVDNPMCPATGHRICNDCMKSCVYQKQDPVNVPQVETRVLTDLLDLPWGVEIYDLLARWNPLRQTQYIAKSYNGLKIMIAGMGPAGFTLAHHLLQEGFAVVGFDGLKIEPLPAALKEQPIFRYQDLIESLDERKMAGFGGVAEYGITVRWDKNFLKLIYLNLMRRPHFQVFGSVRFGGTITIEDAWELGFDHFVVAVGAGLPKALHIPFSLAPGMRQANDFLMALQLGSAAKLTSLANLQIRMPAVVIGGGLTGVDTATELQAYYIRLVEKILLRYEVLVTTNHQASLLSQLDQHTREILFELIQHGKEVRDEREHAARENRKPNFIKLLRKWGGVTIVYRRAMQESPAYIHNHEELKKALEEGIYYLEGLDPKAVDLDEYGHAKQLIAQKRIRDVNGTWIATNEEIHLPAKAILVATGTQPNTAYEFEHRGTFNRLNLQYQHYEDVDGQLAAAHGTAHCKEEQFGPFTSYRKDDYRVSLIGDTHPVFHGSVVKAIASGMRTYPKILNILQDKCGNTDDYPAFAKRMQDLFSTNIHSIARLRANIIEVVVRAPLAAKHYKPGQFYRLQNYETNAVVTHNSILLMEPLALVSAHCDKQQGLLTFNIVENQAAARLCATLKPGDPVALMGPTGVRAKIPNEPETLLIIGTPVGFPFMRSFGAKLMATGNRVIFLVQATHANDIYCQDSLEQSSHRIIWLCKEGVIHKNRDTDLLINQPNKNNNNIIAALIAYAELNHPSAEFVSLQDVDRIFVVGETDLLRSFQAARKTILKDYLVKDPKVFGSVYGNMQCMLKGVCAQCLQWQIDPETGLRTKAVFACSWQDQPLEIIDLDHADSRNMHNHALEQFNHLWIDYLFAQGNIERV